MKRILQFFTYDLPEWICDVFRMVFLREIFNLAYLRVSAIAFDISLILFFMGMQSFGFYFMLMAIFFRISEG